MLGMKVKVEAIIELVRIGSEKVTVIGLVRETWVCVFNGTVETTVGGVRSGLDKPGPSPFTRASHDVARRSRARDVIERDNAAIEVLPGSEG